MLLNIFRGSKIEFTDWCYPFFLPTSMCHQDSSDLQFRLGDATNAFYAPPIGLNMAMYNSRQYRDLKDESDSQIDHPSSILGIACLKIASGSLSFLSSLKNWALAVP